MVERHSGGQECEKAILGLDTPLTHYAHDVDAHQTLAG